MNLLLVLSLFSMNLTAQKKHNIIMDWKIAATLPAKQNDNISLGFAGVISGIYEGKIIVAGGANFPNGMPWMGGKKVYNDDMYVYELKEELLQLQNKIYTLPEPIAYSASTTCSQGIIYAGGESESGLSKKVFVIRLSNDGLKITRLPDLPIAIANASIVNINDTIYLAGGETISEASNQLIVLDLNNLKFGWKQLKSIPLSLSHAVMVVQQADSHKKLYLLGGRQKKQTGISELFNTIFEFDIEKNNWNKKTDLPYSISAGTGVAFNDEKVLLLGGDKGTTFHKVETLIAAINKETDAQKKEALNAQKIKLQSTHPGFSKEMILYDCIKDTCIIIGEIPFSVPVTTNTFKNENQLFITSGEIRAGVRTPNILSAKMVQP